MGSQEINMDDYNNGFGQNGSGDNRPPQNNGQYRGNGQFNNGRPPKKNNSWIPFVIIAAVVILLFISVFAFVLRMMTGGFMKKYGMYGTGTSDDDINYSVPYIAVLGIDGTIQGDSGSELQTQSYHHSWTLKKIKQLKSDSNNRALIMTVNTPGGGVYESDELYLAIKDYKESTGRPVYSYMESQATSGGYYISAPCDKIIANRNCWTGSIGVTIGTLYNITGLLEKYGVKTVTIDSGPNKSMGSMTEELTEEQQEILQSLVDEAYEQFVGIVAEGRGMSVKEVKKIGDGRIYTAKQAKEIGLIDEVATYDEAVDDMKKRFELDSCVVHKIEYKSTEPLIYRLLMETAEIGRSRTDTELDAVKSLMDQNSKFTVTYLAEVQK